MSAGQPWMCTGMTAFVRGVMARFEPCRVEGVGPGVDVGEDRNGHLVQHAGGAGQERVSRHDHLVARADADRRQGHVQRGGAAASGQAVLGPEKRGEFVL